MSEGRLRIDQLLVERGLAESRERAQALVIAGYVLVDGQKARKPGQAAKRDSFVELTVETGAAEISLIGPRR